MGLNLAHEQIAPELGLNPDEAQRMTSQWREGIVRRKPEVVLSGAVACDEVDVVAGHKGYPEAVRENGRDGHRRRLTGAPGRGTLEKKKPPLFGLIPRSGEVVIRMRAHVQQVTIRPLIQRFIAPGSVVYTDAYDLDHRLTAWGYEHPRVGHAAGEFARDEDGDGFCEVHVHTMEGFWSLLRSGLRPHRGISQEERPLYLGFFEFVHNVRRPGKALRGSLIELLVRPPFRNTG